MTTRAAIAYKTSDKNTCSGSVLPLYTISRDYKKVNATSAGARLAPGSCIVYSAVQEASHVYSVRRFVCTALHCYVVIFDIYFYVFLKLKVYYMNITLLTMLT